MELRQLRYLVALADERHFTRAAARAHVAQPALSRQIGKLEAELGVRLVHRTTRRVTLSEPGLALADRARRILAEVDAAAAEARELAGTVGGALRIGVTTTPGPLDVADLLATFHGRHPAVELVVREELSTALADLLRSGELDVAFVTDVGPGRSARLETRHLAGEELVLCVAPEHHLAGRDRVAVAELRDERFIAFRPGATIRERVTAAAARAGFTPRIAFESSETSRVRAVVARGLAVAVLPRSDAGAPGHAVATVALDDPELVHDVYAAWRADRRPTPAAQALLALTPPG